MDACDLALRRIKDTPQLQPYRDLILYGCPEGDERWAWIATAPLSDVLAWAQGLQENWPAAHIVP